MTLSLEGSNPSCSIAYALVCKKFLYRKSDTVTDADNAGRNSSKSAGSEVARCKATTSVSSPTVEKA